MSRSGASTPRRSYAKVRVQFGRPIGQFQGVKHRCAEMLARTELARAAVWDAARAADDLAIRARRSRSRPRPRSRSTPRSSTARTACRRSAASASRGSTTRTSICGARSRCTSSPARPTTGACAPRDAALGGARRRLAVDLPARRPTSLPRRGARAARRDHGRCRRANSATGSRPPATSRRVGPTPWGRDAKALELLVIEEEFRAAKVTRPNIGVGAWALPNLIVHGTEEQQERWIMPTLRGEIGWCQLFSEPGAGSDLASLSTRATRVEGGWLLNGQKVWTSMAKEAEWGICLARTDPDAPKHDGISCFMVDMKTPGIDIRPLRELTGAGDVQRGVLRRRVRARGLPRRRGARRLARRPHDARQRTRVHGFEQHDRRRAWSACSQALEAQRARRRSSRACRGRRPRGHRPRARRRSGSA